MMKSSPYYNLRRCLVAGGLAFYGAFLPAQQLSVSPLRVTFKSEQNSETLTIRNPSTVPLTIQPKVMQWSQVAGKDVLEATRDVLVAPPLVEIAPGETQIIRIALRRAPDAVQELSYRILLQQVVAPKRADSTGINFAFNVSLPIFVLPAVAEGTPAPTAQLQWAAKLSDKMLLLSANNTGALHLQVKKYRVESATGVSESQQMQYVLPGRQQEFAVKAPAGISGAGQKVTIVADTDAGEIRREALIQ